MAGFRLTTKVQVSGWRFLLRRVEHAIVRRDTRMFDDPLQFYSRAVRPESPSQSWSASARGSCVLQTARKAGRRHPSRRPHHQPALCRDARHRSAAPGLQPDLGPTGPRQRGHPDGGEVRRAEPDAEGSAHRHSRRSVRHPGGPVCAQSMWTLCDTVTKPESVAPTVDTSVIVLPLITDGSVGPSGPIRACWCPYQNADWLVTDDRQARDRPVRPGRDVGGGNPGDREGDADLGGVVQRAAERGAVAAAAGSRRRRAEYRWPTGESGDRLGVPDGDRLRRAEVRRAARRSGEGQRHHGCGVAGHQLLRPDLAAVGGVQRRRQDRRAGLHLAAAGQGRWRSSCARTRRRCAGRGNGSRATSRRRPPCDRGRHLPISVGR